MQVAKCLSPQAVLLNPPEREKWSLFRRLTTVVRNSPALAEMGANAPSAEYLFAQVEEREARANTAMGAGFAFPHARIDGPRQVAIAIALFLEPIDLGAVDKKPVSMVCLAICPENNPTVALKVMSSVVRLFRDTSLQQRLLHATDEADAYWVLKTANLPLDIAITARDLMRPAISEVRPDTPLREVTHLMSRHRLQAVAVLDEQGGLVGEISCETLFKVGLPDFFQQLKSVSFIDEFDPFEKYFETESRATAKDVMTHSPATIGPNGTLMEVVFALAVLRHPKVFVLEEGRLVGAIDQSLVLDRIINL